MTSFDVTRRAVAYGAFDTYTGWPAKTYTESTIKMPIFPKGSSFSVGGMGFYAQYDHTGFTSDVVADGDEIKDSFDYYYRVNTHTAYTRGTTFDYYMCDLIRLEPHHDRASTSGTWHLDSSAALTDPRYRHKSYLSAITATNIKKDDGATNAATHIMFDEPDFHWIRLFDTLAKDVVFTVSRGDCTSLLQYHKKPYAFNESCTVTITAINKATVTAVNVIEQAEQEIRHVLTDYASVAGSSFRSLDHIKNFTSKVGGVMVYGVQLELRYVRVNHDFTPTVPTVSHGHGWLEDFKAPYDTVTAYELGSTVFTATSNGAGDGTTIINTAHTQANDYWIGYTVTMLTGTCAAESCIVSAFTAASDTITLSGVGFSAQIDSGDTYQITKWAEVEDGQTLTATTTEQNYLTLTCSVSAGNKIGYVEHKLTTQLSQTACGKARLRYMTSDTNVKAKGTLIFTDGTTQDILASSSSTAFTTTAAVALTASKTVDKIRFYCNSATGTVYYDFAMIYEADFVLPDCIKIDISPPVRDAYLEAPGMLGAHIQSLGAEAATVTLTCDLDFGNWKRSGDTIDGEVFLDLSHELASSTFGDWIWLDADYVQMKVRFAGKTPTISNEGRSLAELSFIEYGNGSSTYETYTSRFGIGL